MIGNTVPFVDDVNEEESFCETLLTKVTLQHYYITY